MRSASALLATFLFASVLTQCPSTRSGLSARSEPVYWARGAVDATGHEADWEEDYEADGEEEDEGDDGDGELLLNPVEVAIAEFYRGKQAAPA